jgi:hypothetical protein
MAVRFFGGRVSSLEVNDLSDQQLLHEYAKVQSDAAFAELVRRHVDKATGPV